MTVGDRTATGHGLAEVCIESACIWMRSHSKCFFHVLTRRSGFGVSSDAPKTPKLDPERLGPGFWRRPLSEKISLTHVPVGRSRLCVASESMNRRSGFTQSQQGLHASGEPEVPARLNAGNRGGCQRTDANTTSDVSNRSAQKSNSPRIPQP